VYQPGPQKFKQPTEKTSLPNQRANDPADKLSVDTRYPPPDIVPSWPLLLDKIPVDVDCLEVRLSRKEEDASGAYTITALSGGQVLEWKLRSV
jgi:hypothetical protein